MDRNRALPLFHGDDPPVYPDPEDVATPPTGTIQTDPTKPQTTITSEHMQLLTEELRNLVMEMGLTPATNNDKQLQEAFKQGPYTPVMEDLDPDDVIFANGYYRCVGKTVRVWVEFDWQNTNAVNEHLTVKIRPPLEFDDTHLPVYDPAGVIGYEKSDFGSDNATDRIFQPVLKGSGAATRIHIVGGVLGGIDSEVRMGHFETKIAVLQIEYPTNGVPIP